MEQQKRIRLAQLTAAQYDAILNHCNSNIFVTDGQGMILYANDAICGACPRQQAYAFMKVRCMWRTQATTGL